MAGAGAVGGVGGTGGMGAGGFGSGGNASGPLCQALGGTCVLGTWAQCPPGFEPALDIHADCMPPDAVRGYFCCVPAPASTCSDSQQMVDCFAGACELCWAPVGAPTVLSCEAGRTCCGYVCLD